MKSGRNTFMSEMIKCILIIIGLFFLYINAIAFIFTFGWYLTKTGNKPKKEKEERKIIWKIIVFGNMAQKQF